MRLFVCWTTRDVHLPWEGKHSCTRAYDALRDAGHDPKVVRALSFGGLPGVVQTPSRKLVKEKTGSYWVPALETDKGEWISGSSEITSWAEQHPT